MVLSNGFKVQGGLVSNASHGPIQITFDEPFTAHAYILGFASVAVEPEYSGESYTNLGRTGFELYHRNGTTHWAVAGF
jgi:hypothetical protein